MNQVLKPVNIAGALLIVQVCLLMIMTVGTILNRNANKASYSNGNYLLITLLAIFSIFFVAFTSDYYPVWSPILGDVALPTISRSNAFAVVFIMDMIAACILIINTGGSNISPFTSVLFLIPSLAIFLREPPSMFFLYAFAVFIIYIATFSNRRRILISGSEDSPISDMTHKFVSGACLALGVLIGYITRPILI